MSESRILFGFHAVLSRMRQHAASVQEILSKRTRLCYNLITMRVYASWPKQAVLHTVP